MLLGGELRSSFFSSLPRLLDELVHWFGFGLPLGVGGHGLPPPEVFVIWLWLLRNLAWP